ncbi:MAG: tetratricopeptide repeat protein [Chlamydiales bacterium]|nr:tetratricopeptide repeat protein [Chlamydiales bacterium]
MKRALFLSLFSAMLLFGKENAEVIATQRELKRDPDNVELLYKMGNLYMDEGEIEKAEGVLKRAEALDPRNQAIQLKLAYLYFWEGNLSEARDRVVEVLYNDPKNIEALILAGRIELLEENGPAATAYFEKAFKYDPEKDEVKRALSQIKERDTYVNLRALKEKARTSQKSGDLEGAIKKYETLVQEFPDNYENHFELGRLYLQSGQYDKARKTFDQALKISPGNTDVQLQLAQIELRQRNYDQAQKEIEKILKKHSKNVDALFMMGQVFTQKKEDQKAAKYLNKALEIDPKRDDVRLALYRLETGWGPIGEELALAKEYEREAQYSQAEEIYLNLLKEHPNNLGVEYRLGHLYSWMGRYDESRIYLRRVIAADPNYVDARVAYVYLLYREKRIATAEREVEAILRKDPTNGDALVAGGLIANAQGKEQLAKKRFKGALMQDPESPEALIGLGRIASQRKEYRKGFDYYEKVYGQDPYNDGAYNGILGTRPYVYPTLYTKGSYAEERENDLVLKIRTTQMNTSFGSLGALFPINDHLRLSSSLDYLGTEQVNLIRKIDNYMVNTLFWHVGGEGTVKRYWTIKGQSTLKWSWNSAKTLFPFERKTSWEPLLSVRFDRAGLMALALGSMDSFIARNFDVSRSFMIERKNVILSSSYRYAPDFGNFGFTGRHTNYNDTFNNQEKDFETWIQSPAVDLGGHWMVRYAWHWGSYAKVNPDYYSYRYKVRHKIKGIYLLRRDPGTEIELSYMWTWAKERDFSNENNAVIVPALTQPQTLKKNLYDAHTVEALFRKNFATQFWFECSTRYYFDSNKYRAWLGRGELRYVF